MNWHLVEGSGMKGFVGVLAICPSIDILDIERGFRGLPVDDVESLVN